MCFPYKVDNSDGQRSLVTARDVTMGDILYVEEPIVVGPNHEGEPVCLSCLTPVSCDTVCSDCEYPMCSRECAQDPDHADECGILRQKNSLLNYHTVLPLRLLLKNSSKKEIFNLTSNLMHHEKQRRESDYWDFSEKHIVELLNDFCGDFNWSHEDIRKAVGILEVNAYEIENYGGSGFRGLYPLSSLVNHGCIDNCTMVMQKQHPYTNTVVAARNLSAGDEIQSSYVAPITCGLLRHRALESGWLVIISTNMSLF